MKSQSPRGHDTRERRPCAGQAGRRGVHAGELCAWRRGPARLQLHLTAAGALGRQAQARRFLRGALRRPLPPARGPYCSARRPRSSAHLLLRARHWLRPAWATCSGHEFPQMKEAAAPLPLSLSCAGGGEGEERKGGCGRGVGEQKGSRLDPGLPRACLERALSGAPVPASQPRPAPRTSASASPGAPRPLPPAAARLGPPPPPAPARPPPQLSGATPGTRVLAPSFLPSSPRARPRSPGLPPGPRLSRCPSVRRRLAPRAASLAPPAPPAAAAAARAPARRARGREGKSGRARPRPAPRQPCPARKDQEDEQRRQSREGEHPERGQPSGGRGTGARCGGHGPGRRPRAGSLQSAGRGCGARVPGRRSPGGGQLPRTVAPGKSMFSCFGGVRA